MNHLYEQIYKMLPERSLAILASATDSVFATHERGMPSSEAGYAMGRAQATLDHAKRVYLIELAAHGTRETYGEFLIHFQLGLQADLGNTVGSITEVEK